METEDLIKLNELKKIASREGITVEEAIEKYTK